MSITKICPTCKGDYETIVEGEGWVTTCENKNCKFGRVEREPSEKIYINAYRVTRHFGGHEEGGWYYDWFECLEVVKTRVECAEEVKDDLEKEYGKLRYGNISSVLGGADIVIYIEDEPRASQTKERPHYE